MTLVSDLKTDIKAGYGLSCNLSGKIWWMRSKEPETEDKKKKVEGANMAALLTPGPPYFTLRKACNQG